MTSFHQPAALTSACWRGLRTRARATTNFLEIKAADSLFGAGPPRQYRIVSSVNVSYNTPSGNDKRGGLILQRPRAHTGHNSGKFTASASYNNSNCTQHNTCRTLPSAVVILSHLILVYTASAKIRAEWAMALNIKKQ